MTLPTPPFTTAMVIPTGVGARWGGFAGDATVPLSQLSAVSDVLITHPNVANAAVFQKLPENALYVEGYALDQWLMGRSFLRPVRSHRVGVVFDAGIEPGMRTLHNNVLAAVRTVYGVSVLEPVTTSEPLQLVFEQGSSGSSGGRLKNPAVLLQAAEQAKSAGATALALAVRMQEPEASMYSEGVGVDPIGGLEAILSHYVTQALNLPCAHAPVFDAEDAAPVTDRQVDPKTAAEYIAPTFLPCVLQGLGRAPMSIPCHDDAPYLSQRFYDLHVSDLSALVVPNGCLGGIPAMTALHRGIPLIVVEGNTTVGKLTADALCETWPSEAAFGAIVRVQNYDEAAGVLVRLRLGLAC